MLQFLTGSGTIRNNACLLYTSYMDGANMNAQVGLTNPGTIGADVCHLNLHKTFASPHGGGGPGVGPVCVAEHLVPFLPGHQVWGNSANQVSSAPYGSAGILPITYGYICMMGAEGLTNATKTAILSANYLAACFKDTYGIVYTGATGFVGHEMILDCRYLHDETGISENDIAKRLMDYGYHAPTLSFPVHGKMCIRDRIVPASTLSPCFFSTGIGSPLIMLSSIKVFPPTMTPSTGICSPGRTLTLSPT